MIDNQSVEELLNFDPTKPRAVTDTAEPAPTPTAELNFHKMFALFIDSVADCVIARIGSEFAEKRISAVIEGHDDRILAMVLNSCEFDSAVKGLIEDADIEDIVDDRMKTFTEDYKFIDAVTEVVRELDFEVDCKVRVS